MNWKDKRLKELQDMIDNGCDPDLLIDEYHDIQLQTQIALKSFVRIKKKESQNICHNL